MRKLVIRSILISVVLHVVILLGTVGVGFVKTWLYVPSGLAGQTVFVGENSVAFGVVSSDWWLVLSLGLVAILAYFAQVGFRYWKRSKLV